MLAENIAFVLVSPKNSGNVGAVARALKNMGFRDLRLVNPRPVNWLDAIQMACGAEDLIEQARVEASLEGALSDITWVVGTTARRRRYAKTVSSPQDIARTVVSLSQENRIAFLFGSEKYGLTTQEMSFCHQAVTIPTQEDFCSLNLSQAVMVVAWELFKVFQEGCHHRSNTQPHQPRMASQDDLQGFFLHLEQVLTEIGFITEENSRHMMLSLKEMIRRKAVTGREVRILRGILRQVQHSRGTSTSRHA
ncbi:MAG: RNA methyltransferase [bacterium]